MKDLVEFLQRVDHLASSPLERACAALWWVGRDDAANGMSAAEICRVVEASGHPQQNSSRLNSQLADDTRTTRVRGSNKWRLQVRARGLFDSKFESFVARPRAQPSSDSVLPRTLFNGTRGYLEKVVHQVNASYDIHLFDCCAVMCRRLLESLIIEVYEEDGRAPEIKGSDGHFFMFSDLLRVLLQDRTFNISRNAKRGLEDFKKLGDLSAHSRRFNANQNDIDRVRDGMRVAAEELLHLAKLPKPARPA